MRLTENEVTIIKKTFQEFFGSEDHLWLFGSRVDDKQQGGDIDLFIETQETNADLAVNNKIKLAIKLWEMLGEQKIDIVLSQISDKEDLPIYLVAKETGIQLV